MEKPKLRLAAILRNRGSALEIPCVLKIWYPLDAHENFRLQVEIQNREDRTHDLLQTRWTIESAHPLRHVLVEDVYIEEVATHRDASGKTIGFEIQIDYTERLTIGSPQHSEGPHCDISIKHCFFYLSELDFGTKQLKVMWSHLGGGEPNGVEPLTINCPADAPVSSFKLTRHYQYREDPQLKRTIVGSQAVLVVDTEFFPSLAHTVSVLAYAKDIALLLSLAARHPVTVISEMLAGDKWQRESHWQPLERVRASQSEQPYPLIEETELANFLALALKAWQAMLPSQQETLRHVLVSLNPWKTAAVADRFLAMSTALESLTDKPAIDVKRSALQGTAKRLIANAISKIDGLSDEEKNDWERNISKLWQGRAQQGKTVSLLEKRGVSNYGLWPLSKCETGPGLIDIRNHLAHGRTYKREQQAALVYATKSLRTILERVVLSMLNYAYQQSAAMHLDENWETGLSEYQCQLDEQRSK